MFGDFTFYYYLCGGDDSEGVVDTLAPHPKKVGIKFAYLNIYLYICIELKGSVAKLGSTHQTLTKLGKTS